MPTFIHAHLCLNWSYLLCSITFDNVGSVICSIYFVYFIIIGLVFNQVIGKFLVNVCVSSDPKTIRRSKSKPKQWYCDGISKFTKLACVLIYRRVNWLHTVLCQITNLVSNGFSRFWILKIFKWRILIQGSYR